ncbi:MAG TPA: PQQ-binding-like beta-propeller repeat protein [Pseudonocardiaceae bacterium]|nr:PQQ-binding-like beta-propeller repeat protein [Pseudonocardiaceae bacterium]
MVARLGEGGMGVVYLGRSPAGRAIALKVVRERFASDPEYRARFRREVSAARRVTGAFAAPVLDADPDAAAAWLVTAYLPGLSLREAVNAVGGLPLVTTRALAVGLAEALVEIHRVGLTHRDLKPSNVILTAHGPRVIDFGIARPEDATSITGVGTIIGTPGFMAPEQSAGAGITPAADIYALGAVLCFAATGHEATADEITDPWLRQFVQACLRPQPEARPSAADLLTSAPAGGGEWLPAALAEAIDRRAAEAQALLHTPTARQPAPPPAEPTSLATLAPAPVPQPRLTRRRLITIGGILLAAGGATAAGVLGASGRRPVSAPPHTTSRPSTTTTVAPPPQAILKWKTKVSAYYPDVYVSAGAVVALTQEDQSYGLDAAGGAVKWQLASGQPSVISADTAYLNDPIRGKVIAVDPVSGSTRWSYEPPFVFGAAMPDLPIFKAVAGPLLCCGDNQVRALATADGRTRWIAKVDTERGLAGDPGVATALSDTALTALEPSTGHVRWTYPITHGSQGSVANGLAYAYDQNATLLAIRADTGALAWQLADANDEWLASGNGTAYLGGGQVRAYATVTGELLWSAPIGTTAGESPRGNTIAVDGSTLYVGSPDHHVYALDAATGHVGWIYAEDVTLTSAPAVGGGLVYIGTHDGYVACIGPPGGSGHAPS